jgi:hypothetical protein
MGCASWQVLDDGRWTERLFACGACQLNACFAIDFTDDCKRLRSTYFFFRQEVCRGKQGGLGAHKEVAMNSAEGTSNIQAVGVQCKARQSDDVFVHGVVGGGTGLKQQLQSSETDDVPALKLYTTHDGLLRDGADGHMESGGLDFDLIRALALWFRFFGLTILDAFDASIGGRFHFCERVGRTRCPCEKVRRANLFDDVPLSPYAL